jgi:ATP-dependent Clp protease ATP-binding subunit ClpA
MDDGRLTDSFGNTIDFRNCIIVMTSNIGCKDYFDKQKIGFSETTRDESVISNSIKNYFLPEFLNRLDDIIIFNTLNEESYSRIFDVRLCEFIRRYSDAGKIVEISDVAKKELLSRCFSVRDGARFISKNISTNIESIIINSIENGLDNIFVDFIDNKFVCEEEKDIEKQH